MVSQTSLIEEDGSSLKKISVTSVWKWDISVFKEDAPSAKPLQPKVCAMRGQTLGSIMDHLVAMVEELSS